MNRLVIVLSTFFVSVSALAMHADKDMDCTSETLTLHYKGTMAVGGDFAIASTRNSSSGKQNVELFARTSDTEIYGREKGTGEDALFTILSSKNINQVTRETDCYYEHTAWRSETIVKFDNVSTFAQQQLGICEGTIVKFICDEATHYPISHRCD